MTTSPSPATPDKTLSRDLASGALALAIAEIGSLSERRISLMMDKHMSQLPPFLVANGGVNSGFMIAQVTAAALASENKALSHPHSVDSLPTSANFAQAWHQPCIRQKSGEI